MSLRSLAGRPPPPGRSRHATRHQPHAKRHHATSRDESHGLAPGKRGHEREGGSCGEWEEAGTLREACPRGNLASAPTEASRTKRPSPNIDRKQNGPHTTVSHTMFIVLDPRDLWAQAGMEPARGSFHQRVSLTRVRRAASTPPRPRRALVRPAGEAARRVPPLSPEHSRSTELLVPVGVPCLLRHHAARSWRRPRAEPRQRRWRRQRRRHCGAAARGHG